jgi:hypothetical protein
MSVYKQLNPKLIGPPELLFTRHHGKIQVENFFVYLKAA